MRELFDNPRQLQIWALFPDLRDFVLLHLIPTSQREV